MGLQSSLNSYISFLIKRCVGLLKDFHEGLVYPSPCLLQNLSSLLHLQSRNRQKLGDWSVLHDGGPEQFSWQVRSEDPLNKGLGCILAPLNPLSQTGQACAISIGQTDMCVRVCVCVYMCVRGLGGYR